MMELEQSWNNRMTELQRRAWTKPVTILLLCLLTFGIRMAYSALVPISPVHDEWDHVAENLALGRGFVSSWPKTYISPETLGLTGYEFPLIPTGTRVPVPVIYFASLYRLFGVNDQSLLIGQWVLDTLTCAVLFILALELFGDKRVAVLTCVAWAFYVPAMWMTNSRFSEPMCTFTLACFMYILVRAIRTRSMWQLGLAGIMWGIATLSRPVTASLPVLLFPVLFLLWRHQLRFALQACIVIVLGGVLVVSPWAYRNYKIYDAFVPVSTLGGLVVFRDHYLMDRDDYLSYRDYHTVELAAKEMFDRRFGSVAVVETADKTVPLIDRAYGDAAWAKIRQYPDRYIVLSFMRLLRLWFNVGYGDAPSWRSYLILAAHLTLLGLTSIMLLFYRGSWVPKIAPILALLVHHTGTYIAMASTIRYSVPVAPYPIILGAFALVYMLDQHRAGLLGNRKPAGDSRI